MEKTKGTLCLLTAALIWGTAFVAQTTAAEHIGSFTFNASRYLIAAVFLYAVILIRGSFGRASGKEKAAAVSLKPVLVGGICCGLALCVASAFQQFGIAAYPPEAAASGRAGFLTATYVVIVAVCELFKGKKLHPVILIACGLCLGGMYQLCVSDGFSKIYLGDILVLCCAFCFTAHILIIDRFSGCDGIRLSCMQFIVAGALSLILALCFETIRFSDLLSAGLPILYTGILSCGAAYTLQIIGQKYADPAVASIAMSMESVFAMLAGWLILNEQLSPKELLGCGLVFAAVILSQIPEFLNKRN